MHPAMLMGLSNELEKIAADPRVVGALAGGGASLVRSAVREYGERTEDIRHKLGPKRKEDVRKRRMLGYGARAVGSAALGAVAGHAYKNRGNIAKHLAGKGSELLSKAKDHLSDAVAKGVKGGDIDGQVERGVRKGIPGGSKLHDILHRFGKE